MVQPQPILPLLQQGVRKVMEGLPHPSLMATAMPTTTSRDGTTIASSVTGSGPALILVDSALCSRAFGPAGGRYFMCDVVGMPQLMGYAFALFPMCPKRKQAANPLPYDLTIMADTRSRVRDLRPSGSRSWSAEGRRAPRRSRGRSHTLGAVPAAAMMKEFFR